MKFKYLIENGYKSDAPINWGNTFQDPATEIMREIHDLHDNLMFYLILISIGVFVICYFALFQIMPPGLRPGGIVPQSFLSFNLKVWEKNSKKVPKIINDFQVIEKVQKIKFLAIEEEPELKKINGWGSTISRKRLDHDALLELVWTIIPAIILVFIGIPSFNLLYGLDENFSPLITLKVQGSQWFWSYAISDHFFTKTEPIHDLSTSAKLRLSLTTSSPCVACPSGEPAGATELIQEGQLFKVLQGSGPEFDSFLLPTDELIKGDYRLLEVDNPVILPTNINIRVIITSADVLHSWSINAFGLKMDAVPGRLNQTGLNINRSGVYYGQCSELCGVGHSLMPIVIEAVHPEKFINWLAISKSIII